MNFSRPHETVTVLDQRVSTNRYMPPRQNRKERVKKYLPHHFREEPLLKRFLTPFQAFPCIGDILKIKRNKTKPKLSFRIYKAKISSFHQPKRKKKSWCPTYRNHFAFGGHVSRSVGQTQLCLQRVEVGFQLRLLFNTGRLVLAAVLPVLVQFLLHTGQRIISLTRLEPWQGPLDPFQQLKEKGKKEDYLKFDGRSTTNLKQ